MPKITPEDKLNKFVQLLEEYNAIYDTNFTIEQIQNLTKARVEAITTSRQDLKELKIQSYNLEYKKLARNLFKNHAGIITENRMFEDFNKLLDQGLYCLTDIYETKVYQNDNAYVSIPVTKTEQGYETAYLDEKSTYISKDEQKGTYLYSNKNMVIDSKYKNQKYIENCSYIRQENGYDLVSIGLLPNGAMGQEELEQFYKDSLNSYGLAEKYSAKSVLKDELIESDSMHSENLIEVARAKFAEGRAEFDRKYQTNPQNALKEFYSNAVPAYALLKEKRESRGFFNVLFHPFKAHAETVALREIRQQADRLLNKINLTAQDFDNSVSSVDDIPSFELDATLKDVATDYLTNRRRLEPATFGNNCQELEAKIENENAMLQNDSNLDKQEVVEEEKQLDNGMNLENEEEIEIGATK